MKKILPAIGSLAVILALVLNFQTAHANIWSNFNNLGQQVSQAARAAIEQAHQDHCNAVKQKIAEKTDDYHSFAEANSIGYAQMLSILAKTISDAKSRGYNTNKLETYYDELDNKIDAFNSASATFYMRGVNAKNNACVGANDANNAHNLASTRDMLHKMKDTASEIKNYYKNTVRPEILDVKTQEYVEN